MTSYAELAEVQSNYTEKDKTVFVDSKTGGYKEVVVFDRISVTETEYILIIEAEKRSNLVQRWGNVF